MRKNECRGSSNGWDERDKTPKKRIIVLTLCGLLLAFGLSAYAQQAKKAHICYLTTTPDVSGRRVLIERLRDLGHIEGQNLTIEYRYAEGKIERLPDLAAALINANCEVIITAGIEATTAARNATNTIPIVIAFAPDAVRHGFVASLSRPGGNITGQASVDLTGKRLELLREVVPKLSRVGFLWSSSNPDSDYQAEESEAAAASLRIAFQPLEVKSADEIGSAFRSLVQGRSGALIVSRGGFFRFHQKQIIELAAKNRLPTIYGNASYPEAGGLMSYAEDRIEQFRRTAVTVDKILKGAKPADLPMEQPTKFELVINLKTAKQIGLTIPPNVLARADRVIK